MINNLTFLDPVGPSTFKYGITIPVAAQSERYLTVGKGQKLGSPFFCDALAPVTAEDPALEQSARPSPVSLREQES